MVIVVGVGRRARAEAEAEAEAEEGVVRVEEESLADWRILVIESPMLAISRRILSPLSTVGS